MPKRPGLLRRIVLWTLAVATALTLVLAGVGIWVYSALRVTNAGELSFTNELHVPPELEPVVDEDGRKRFDLTMQEGTSDPPRPGDHHLGCERRPPRPDTAP